MQPARQLLPRLAPPLIAWSAGMLLVFFPVFASGFAGVPGDLGDARLTHYLLEHGYRWLAREGQHRDLWSPVFFFPLPNVAGYSDLLLSAVPFYGCWRLLGIAPDTSFQLCFLALVSLNFASLYLFLTRCFGLSEWPAAAGASLFAFAFPRLVHIVHLQLHVHCYSVLAAYALARLLGPPGASRLPGYAWALLFWVGAVGQLYASFYLGWFLALGLVACAGWALLLPASRAAVLAARRHGLSFLVAGLLAAIPLWWMAHHYLDAARSVAGLYPYEQAGHGLPNPAQWFSRGPDCWFSVTGGLVALGALARNPWPGGELALGIGPVTTVLALLGLLRERRRPAVRVLLLASATLVVCFSVLWFPESPGLPGQSLYRFLFPLLPGAGAIRVPGRIILLLLIPAAVGLAYFLQRWPGWAVALAVLAVCLLEQGRTTPTFDKFENRARIAGVVEAVERLPRRPRAFYVSRRVRERPPMVCQTQLDAMWAQIETGVPTINGYSGREPPGWGNLAQNEPLVVESTEQLQAALDDWRKQHGLAREDVAWVEVSGPP
jgi:hypothetical protein